MSSAQLSTLGQMFGMLAPGQLDPTALPTSSEAFAVGDHFIKIFVQLFLAKYGNCDWKEIPTSGLNDVTNLAIALYPSVMEGVDLMNSVSLTQPNYSEGVSLIDNNSSDIQKLENPDKDKSQEKHSKHKTSRAA